MADTIEEIVLQRLKVVLEGTPGVKSVKRNYKGPFQQVSSPAINIVEDDTEATETGPDVPHGKSDKRMNLTLELWLKDGNKDLPTRVKNFAGEVEKVLKADIKLTGVAPTEVAFNVQILRSRPFIAKGQAGIRGVEMSVRVRTRHTLGDPFAL